MPPRNATPDDPELDGAPEDALEAFLAESARLAESYSGPSIPKALDARRAVLDYATPLVTLLGDAEAEGSVAAVLTEVYDELDAVKAQLGSLSLALNQVLLVAQATAHADQLVAALAAKAPPEVLESLAADYRQQAAGARAVMGLLAQHLADATSDAEPPEADEHAEPGESADPPPVTLPNSPAPTPQGTATASEDTPASGTAAADPSSVAAPQKPAAPVFDLRRPPTSAG